MAIERQKISEKDEKRVREGAEKITAEDIEKISAKAEDIEKKFASHGPLSRLLTDAKLMLAIIKDYYNGKYRNIPYWAIGAIAFTLLYVFNPLDLIPDFIPFIGLVDDVAVMAACLVMVEQELHRYKAWKIEHPN
jgi:uncharacterized membrane protein YkvA (DUF1232 family)